MEQLLSSKEKQNEVSDNFTKRLENIFSENEDFDKDFYGGKEFDKKKHIAFLKFCFINLKKHQSYDSHLITILHFIVGSLKMLDSLTEEEKDKAVNYVLINAVICDNKIKGFRSGTFTGWSGNKDYKTWNVEDKPHLAATYCGLCILKMCGYSGEGFELNIEKINNKLKEVYSEQIYFDDSEIIREVLLCQNDEGQFCAQSWDTENDVRFFYCALAIFRILGKKASDIKNLIKFGQSVTFLNRIRSYEGGFSIVDEGESNAGTSYCAVACYHMLEVDIPNKGKLIQWLINRNSSLGVNGRTNKISDTCYSFWVLGSLFNLELADLFDREHTIHFILNCQTIKGGFSKHLNFDDSEMPDILHTFYSLCTLTLLNYEGLNVQKDSLENEHSKLQFDPVLAIPI